MADASDLDTAVINKLATDPTLIGLVPDGVYWDKPPQNSTRFVVVSMSGFDSTLQFQRDSFERHTYLVKAVVLQNGTQVRQAAKRIHELLHLQDLPLSGTGFVLMAMARIGPRIRLTEDDPADVALKWHHRGGHYQVMVAL